MVHLGGAWYQAPVAVGAPCGRTVQIEPGKQPEALALGQQHCRVGLEDAEHFWQQVYAPLAVPRTPFP